MRRYYLRMVALGFSLLAAASGVMAHTSETPSDWAGTQASLGYNLNTGNTRTLNLDLGADVDYAKNRWSNKFKSTIQYGKNDGNVNKQQYFLTDQVNYSCNDISTVNNSIYVKGQWTRDTFAPYVEESVGSVGYTRDWIKKTTFQLSTSVGPSYAQKTERSQPNQTGKTDRNLNGWVSSDVVWNIKTNSSFKENVSYLFGKPSNVLMSTTSYTTNVYESLALQISFALTNWSSIPAGSEFSTDTTTLVSLVYSL